VLTTPPHFRESRPSGQGYLNYTRTDGTTFKNTGKCNAYVKAGGTLVPVGAPSVVINSVDVTTSDGTWSELISCT